MVPTKAKVTETFKVVIVSKLLTIKVDAADRVICLSAIAALTALGTLYLYLRF